MACVVSWHFSGQLCEILPTKLQWHIYLPAHWQQVLRCHLSFTRVPADVLPKNAGAALSTEDQSARQQFYGSLLILIVLAAFAIGKLLTLGATICKMAACCRRDTSYQELKAETSSEVPLNNITHLCGSTSVFTSSVQHWHYLQQTSDCSAYNVASVGKFTSCGCSLCSSPECCRLFTVSCICHLTQPCLTWGSQLSHLCSQSLETDLMNH